MAQRTPLSALLPSRLEEGAEGWGSSSQRGRGECKDLSFPSQSNVGWVTTVYPSAPANETSTSI